MKKLLLLSLLFIYSCANTSIQKSKIVYIHAEKNHNSKENISWTKERIVDAKKGEINLYLEGYFPETKLEENVYGIDDPKLAAVSQAFITYIDIQYFIENVYAMNNPREYVSIVERSFAIYDEADYLRKVKKELNFDIKKVKDIAQLQQFCADFLNYHGQRDLKEYQSIFEHLTKKQNLGEKRFLTFWENVTIKKRDEEMVKNFIKSQEKINNNKDNLLIIGSQHLPGMGKLLTNNGFEVRVLHKK